ncbi:MAG: PD40 domain-containing protein [Chloroflexi bacterium]|nr:PD40 domain-containing protein [Chloroflexota bacterium]
MTVEGKRERPKAFADLWDTKGTRRPPTSVANPLHATAVPAGPLDADVVAGAPGVDRWGGIDLSPDGSEVAFAWDRSGALEIYTAPILGDRIIQLTSADARSVAPRWSPDGHWIAFVRGSGDGEPALWIVDRDGEHEHAVTAGHPMHGAVTVVNGVARWSPDTASPVLAAAGVRHVKDSATWSPDGSAIAFTTSADGRSKIAFAHVRDGAATRVEILGAGPPFEDSDPVWRPDGRGVVYRRHEHGNVTLHRVFTISHADDAVLDVPGWAFSPRVGPDSETVVAILVDARGADVVVRPQGGIAITRITRSALAPR